DNPSAVFTEAILKPETQDMASFVDGINNIVEAQQHVALQYLEDGSIEDACPPLQALLMIMATGSYSGMDIHHPDIRAMFTRESLLASDWYQERLEIKQRRDIEMWKRHVKHLQQFLDDKDYEDEAQRLGMPQRLETAKQKLAAVQEADYLKSLVGTLGADPLTAARAHAEEPVVIWGKASLSPKISKGVVMQGAEPMPVYEVPSLLQRVKSKLKRPRLN
ncbi:MAG: hypothetical protein WBN95_03815, partial [Gammaproteobacteria bacterium]